MDNEILEILKQLKEGQKSLIEGQNRLETKIDETYNIVRALEHSAEVNKSEHDKMLTDIAYIKGDIEAVKKDLCNVEIITSSNWNEIAKLKAVK